MFFRCKNLTGEEQPAQPWAELCSPIFLGFLAQHFFQATLWKSSGALGNHGSSSTWGFLQPLSLLIHVLHFLFCSLYPITLLNSCQVFWADRKGKNKCPPHRGSSLVLPERKGAADCLGTAPSYREDRCSACWALGEGRAWIKGLEEVLLWPTTASERDQYSGEKAVSLPSPLPSQAIMKYPCDTLASPPGQAPEMRRSSSLPSFQRHIK